MIENKDENGWLLEQSCKELPHRKIFPNSISFNSDAHYQIYAFKPETNSIPKELMKEFFEVMNGCNSED